MQTIGTIVSSGPDLLVPRHLLRLHPLDLKALWLSASFLFSPSCPVNSTEALRLIQNYYSKISKTLRRYSTSVCSLCQLSVTIGSNFNGGSKCCKHWKHTKHHPTFTSIACADQDEALLPSCIIGCVSFFSFFFFLTGSSGNGLSSGSGISCAARGAGLGEAPKSTRGSSCQLQGKKAKRGCQKLPEPKAGVSLPRPTLWEACRLCALSHQANFSGLCGLV